MSDQKISALPTILASQVAPGDYIPFVDASEPDATKNKRILISELRKAVRRRAGASLYRTSDITGIPSWPSIITWQAAAYDTDSFWSAGAPTRLTIPSGIAKIRLFYGIGFEFLAAAGSVGAAILKNGGALGTGEAHARIEVRQDPTGLSGNTILGFTNVLDVVAGNYFELQANAFMTGQDAILAGARTYLEVDVIEFS